VKIVPHFTCDPNLIRKRSINTIQKDSLAYLPTIGFNKASIAIRYRNLHFPLKDIKDLEKIKIFDDQQLEILGKYLSFEVD
jgi:DNA uptake protein ComE-like DNA-binding protein